MCNRRNCNFVFECLEELLEDALGENNHCHWNSNSNNVAGVGNRRHDCDFVYECLLNLLEDALGENNGCHHHCHR